MFTPYDWQEGIGNRAQYIEGKLAQGAPVLAVSLEPGILVFTYRRQARKIYEVYDRLLFAGLGQQSDIEALRVAALEFASREGYNRSEEDVTIQRVATAMSAAVKRAFSDFSAAPFVARSLFAEIGETPDADLYYVLDYDGDYSMYRRAAALVSSDEEGAAYHERLVRISGSVEESLEQLKELWAELALGEGETLPADYRPEAVLVERVTAKEDRFRELCPEEF